MAYKTIQRVSVPNLKLFGSMKTELRAKEVGEFSIMSYGKVGWWASFSLRRNINLQRFSELSTAITLAFISIST